MLDPSIDPFARAGVPTTFSSLISKAIPNIGSCAAQRAPNIYADAVLTGFVYIVGACTLHMLARGTAAEAPLVV